MDPVSKAQAGNTQKSSPGDRVKAYRWKKGQSGNRAGRPKKLRITKLYEKILEQGANRKDIEKSVLGVLTGGRMATVLMLREMAERTEGKIEQTMDVNVNATIQYADAVARVRARKKARKSK
jgi:Family of unknown function (DUF5681)